MEFILHNLVGSVQRFRATWRNLQHQPLPWRMSLLTTWNLLYFLRQETLIWFLVEDEASWHFFFQDLRGPQNRTRPLFHLFNKLLQVIAYLGPQGEVADGQAPTRHGAVMT